MELIIDGYNLLHVGPLPIALSAHDLQRERERLIEQLSSYRQAKSCEITVVFDGWQAGWAAEKKERRKGIDLIFSQLGEKADDVIKRLVKEKGPGKVVITSDRDVARYAERMGAAVIPSEQFRERMDMSSVTGEKDAEEGEDERTGIKRKGPSRRLSKKEKRARAALKKL
jgi:predicted RNA-binding protein with PIN domain